MPLSWFFIYLFFLLHLCVSVCPMQRDLLLFLPLVIYWLIHALHCFFREWKWEVGSMSLSFSPCQAHLSLPNILWNVAFGRHLASGQSVAAFRSLRAPRFLGEVFLSARELYKAFRGASTGFLIYFAFRAERHRSSHNGGSSTFSASFLSLETSRPCAVCRNTVHSCFLQHVSARSMFGMERD